MNEPESNTAPFGLVFFSSSSLWLVVGVNTTHGCRWNRQMEVAVAVVVDLGMLSGCVCEVEFGVTDWLGLIRFDLADPVLAGGHCTALQSSVDAGRCGTAAGWTGLG